MQVGDELLAAEQVVQALQALVGENANLIGEVLFELGYLRGFDGLVTLVLLRAFAAEDLHVDDGSLDARRAVERSVANVTGLLTENRAQKFFFRRERGFALRRYLADEDVAGLYGGADADYAAFVEVAQEALVDVGNVPRDFFGAELRVARFDFVLLDVNRSVVVLFDELFADEDGVFKVVTAPWHEGDEHVAAKSEFAAIGARAVGQHLPLLHAVARANERLLADAGVLVRALELREQVNVRAHFAAEHAGLVGLDAHDDALGVNLIDDAVAAANDDRAGITRGDAFHAGADERSFALDQRHGLALHVRSHQRAVRVVVLKEWNQAGSDGDELLRRNVDVVDFFAILQNEVAGLAAVDEFGGDFEALVERGVGLRDHVAVLFPRREIEAVRLDDYAPPLQLLVRVFHLFLFNHFAGFEFAVARVDDLHEVDHAAALHTAIGRLDEAEFVDPRIGRKRADETDVRTFRRFNRADAAVVSRVNVAHFESCAFTRQTTRPKSRKTALVSDFAQRVRLVHELRELRTAEEFANRGHYGLRVHQVVRHGRGHFLVHGHLFLDRALHANQADAELVFEQLAHRADAAIAEMVDVVHRADILAQLQQVLDRRDEVGRIERALVERRLEAELDVEFQAAHFAEIVLARVKKHAIEERGGGFKRRRIAGTQLAVDFDQRFFRSADRVLFKRAAHDHAYVVALREADVDFRDARFGDRSPHFRRKRLVGFEKHFTGLAIYELADGDCAFEVRNAHFHLIHASLDEFFVQRLGDALVRSDQNIFRARMLDFFRELAVDQAFGNVPEKIAFAQA